MMVGGLVLKRLLVMKHAEQQASEQCGGPLTILAAIEDPSVIVKILSHLGLPTRAPPKAPARLDEFFQSA